MPQSYETDGRAIYARSFATIRAEAALARFDPDEEPVAVRMIHACGQVEIADLIRFSPGMAATARAALSSVRAVTSTVFNAASGSADSRALAINSAGRIRRAPGVA